MAQAIRDELIEELLQGYQLAAGSSRRRRAVQRKLKKRLLERALGAELSEHLGYEKGDPAGRGGGNSRNGYSSKTVIGDDGAIEIAVPRDRNGSFEPQIVADAALLGPCEPIWHVPARHDRTLAPRSARRRHCFRSVATSRRLTVNTQPLLCIW